MVDLTASSAHARTILARIGRRSARTARETASSSATRLARASSMTASHVSRLLCRTTAPWCAAARANDERRRRRSRWVSTHAQYERRRILRCASLRIASALALAFLARSTNPPAHRSNARKHSRSALCALATPRFSRRSRRSSAHLAQTANDALRVRPANAPLATLASASSSAWVRATRRHRRIAPRSSARPFEGRSKVVRRSPPEQKGKPPPPNRIARTSARYARNTRPRRVAWYAPYASRSRRRVCARTRQSSNATRRVLSTTRRRRPSARVSSAALSSASASAHSDQARNLRARRLTAHA